MIVQSALKIKRSFRFLVESMLSALIAGKRCHPGEIRQRKKRIDPIHLGAPFAARVYISGVERGVNKIKAGETARRESQIWRHRWCLALVSTQGRRTNMYARQMSPIVTGF